VLDIDGRPLVDIFGATDALKFRSSMTLFACAAPDEPLFREALRKYCDSVQDPLTLDRVSSSAGE
jgi:uncharacterized protein (DUF1810 family)